MRATILCLLPLALCTALTRAQDKPAARDPALSAQAVCDGLLSPDAGPRDRASLELKLLNARRAEDLGRELLSRPQSDACTILAAVGASSGESAIIAAMVAMESKHLAVRSAALDALLDAPRESLRANGDEFLRGQRRENLRASLISEESMRLVCAGLPDVKDAPRAPVERTLRLAILADRYFGAQGLTGMLRQVGVLMLGEDKPDDTSSVEQRERLRRQAAALLESIWIAAPGSQFNYLANATLAQRRTAIDRLNARLDEMQNREIMLGGAKYHGARLGDYLLDLSRGGEVSEIEAAAFLRLQWWKGDAVPIEGEGYAEAVDALNELGRRGKVRLRAELQRWWEGYRADTESR